MTDFFFKDHAEMPAYSWDGENKDEIDILDEPNSGSAPKSKL